MLEIITLDQRVLVTFVGCVVYTAFTLAEAKSWVRSHIQDYK